jgi:hypothetical protein
MVQRRCQPYGSWVKSTSGFDADGSLIVATSVAFSGGEPGVSSQLTGTRIEIGFAPASVFTFTVSERGRAWSEII